MQDYAIPWDVQTRIAGQVTGRAAEADRLVADVRGRIAAARAAHPEFAGRTGITGGWFNNQSSTPTSASSGPTCWTSTRWCG